MRLVFYATSRRTSFLQVPIVIVGNKNDLPTRSITKKTIVSLATALNAPYVEAVNSRRREIMNTIVALLVGKDEKSRRRCFCEFDSISRPLFDWRLLSVRVDTRNSTPRDRRRRFGKRRSTAQQAKMQPYIERRKLCERYKPKFSKFCACDSVQTYSVALTYFV